MFGNKRTSHVPAAPELPSGSASVALVGQLTGILQGSCPAWRDGVARYISESRAEVMSKGYTSGDHVWIETFVSSTPYGKDDRRRFCESVSQDPATLFQLIVEASAGARQVTVEDIVSALARIADRYAPPEEVGAPPKATYAFCFTSPRESGQVDTLPALDLGSAYRTRESLTTLLRSVVEHDLAESGRDPLAPSRHSMVDPIVRAAILLSVQRDLAEVSRGSLSPAVRAEVARQSELLSVQILETCTHLTSQVDTYRQLQRQREDSYALVDRETATDRADTAALSAVARAAGAGGKAPLRVASAPRSVVSGTSPKSQVEPTKGMFD